MNESLFKPTRIYIGIAISRTLLFRERKHPMLLPHPVAAKGQASAPPRNNPQATLYMYSLFLFFTISPLSHAIVSLVPSAFL